VLWSDPEQHLTHGRHDASRYEPLPPPQGHQHLHQVADIPTSPGPHLSPFILVDRCRKIKELAGHRGVGEQEAHRLHHHNECHVNRRL
jgi:hypothetical protein